MNKIAQLIFAFLMPVAILQAQIVETFKGDRFTHYNVKDWISYAPALTINAIDTDEICLFCNAKWRHIKI